MLRTKTRFSLLLLFILAGNNLFAQDYLSPYSKFGLGEVMPSSFIRQRAMGDVSVAASDDNYFSSTNPASYSRIKSFVFETGLNFNFYEIAGTADKFANRDYKIPYFAFAVPLSKDKEWGFSFGLKQFSKIGYLFQQRYSTPVSYNEIYQGSGGYSKFYLGSSLRLFKNFYIGANVGYFFGNQTVNQRIDFDSLTPVSNHRDVYTSIGNLTFDLGMQYKIKLGEKNELQFGASYSMPGSFSSKQDIYYNSFVSIDGTNYISDSIFRALQNSGKVTMPSDLGLGLQFKSEKWLLAIDYHQVSWSEFRFFDRNDSLHNMSSIGIGLQFTPGGKDLAYAPYFQRMKYRAGFRYAQTYYNLNDNQPNDIRFTFGVGLPVNGAKVPSDASMIDLSFEFGQIGDVVKNTIQQRYFGASVGFHLFSGRWFEKIKID